MKKLYSSTVLNVISRQIFLFGLVGLVSTVGCVGYRQGPDKQGGSTIGGIFTGAGAGAVTGAQIASATGPGALIGAGLGATAGGLRGAWIDDLEEANRQLQSQIEKQRGLAAAHRSLEQHYSRRLALHPTRDIFPADLFFEGDSVKLRESAKPIVEELARLNGTRLPWSRMAVVAYVRSSEEENEYAKHLVEHRAKEISNGLIAAGMEPRRLESRGMLLDAPLLIDPHDSVNRYNQAIELVPLDR